MASTSDTQRNVSAVASAGSNNESKANLNRSELTGAGTIKLVIENINANSYFTPTSTSVHKFANLNWYLKSHVDNYYNSTGYTGTYMSLCVCCQSDYESNFWSGEVDIIVELQSQREGTENFIRSGSMVINFYSQQCGFPSFIEYAKIQDRNSPYVRDGKAVIEARISLKRAIRRVAPIFDFTSRENNNSDCILVVEGFRLHILKSYLAMYSPVFTTMLLGDFKESQMDEVPLEDVKIEEFLELLHVIYPSHKPADANNVEFLLKLGDKFDIAYVMKTCEMFLVGAKDVSLNKKLLLGDKYQLSILQQSCIQSLKSSQDITMLKRTNDFNCLSDTTKSALLDKFTEVVR